jgi:enterochelin esterase family protein
MMNADWIQQGKTQGTPIIEGDQAIFFWYGKRAPMLVGDFNDWDEEHPIKLKRAATQVWWARLPFAVDAYVEYAFQLDGKQFLDPNNPCRISSGLGHSNNYFYMPAGSPTSLAHRNPEVPRGKVTRYSVETGDLAAGKYRSVYLYQPPTDQPSPLIVVWDGFDYLRRAHLDILVDNLIAQNRIRPVALAMVNSGGQARLVEYACSEATISFLLRKVLPLAEERLNLMDIEEAPGSFGILGASMGGLMSLYTALRFPHIFGGVISQSGAFDFLGYDSVVYELIRFGPILPLNIWMDIGNMEELLPANRRMRDLLASRGYNPGYVEYNGGHNYTSWQNDVWRGLEAAFGLPSLQSE